FLIILALVAFLIRKSIGLLPAEGRHLPLDTAYSLFRMFAAYILSLFFAIAFGFGAAYKGWARKILLPTIDILQSIPVVGFFPVAVLFFISLFNGERIGVELASVFLIFTSQAWNMAFGIYESLITIPKDLKRAMSSLNLTGWLKFKNFLFPACIPKLTYNSMVSWANGWYFLMACEIISIGSKKFSLPGLGSFLFTSTEKGRLDLTLIAFGVLTIIIILMDILIWRPLTAWSDKFIYQTTPGGETKPKSALLSYFKDFVFFFKIVHVWKFLFNLFELMIIKIELLVKKTTPGIKRFLKVFLQLLITIVSAILLTLALFQVYPLILAFADKGLPAEASLIPLGIIVSFFRILIAYIICLAWTYPLAILIGENEKISKALMPIVQIFASIPATAIFPLIVIFVTKYFIGGMNLASILLVLTGMQWYILFNLIAGIRVIPKEIKESAQAFGASRWFYFKRILLPASFPSLITGSITGWGGAWNALVVSEYVIFQHQTHTAFGIGSLLDIATFE
ncbi:MAG: ABC transporter permease subunit, partial [Actinomycetia bacterium]|nr:ABC transporter permease subunit [Actinomycetes bacterium]